MSIDPLLDRVYDFDTYNCFHFCADAWLHVTGCDDLAAVRTASFDAGDIRAMFRRFSAVAGPTIEPSVVVMENRMGEEHIGLCLRKRLLHITQTGVEFLPIEVAQINYRNMRFYQ